MVRVTVSWRVREANVGFPVAGRSGEASFICSSRGNAVQEDALRVS
jgi:hypothetical protein